MCCRKPVLIIFSLKGFPQYGIKLFPELHGAPGSQNGKAASGCITGPKIVMENGKEKNPEHYFETKWNKKIALRAVEKMAEKCKEYEGTCWGVGVLNEPMLAGKGPGSDRDKVHEFLDQYYEESIKAVRQIFQDEFPVVLFSWTYNFDR